MAEGKGLTYAQAGVDIDAGNRLVDLIRPAVRSTRRPGADGEIGGFGGLFDLKAAGFSDPVLVAANDGVGTKIKIAIESGIHDTIGVDLVAMCVNDLVVQGAEPLFFLDYYATGKLEPDAAAAVVSGIAARLRRGRLRAARRRDRGNAGSLFQGRLRSRGLRRGRGRALPPAAARRGEGGRSSVRPALLRRAFQRLLADPPHRRATPASPGTRPRPSRPARASPRALLAPTRIYVKPLLAALKRSDAILALAHITGGGFPDNLPRVLPKGLGAALDLGAFPVAAGLLLAGAAGRRRRGGNAAHLQLRNRHGRRRRAGRRRRSARGAARGGRDADRASARSSTTGDGPRVVTRGTLPL